MTATLFVWMLIITGGDAKGRMVGPFESETYCEQIRLVFNQRAGSVRDAGVCAKVLR